MVRLLADPRLPEDTRIICVDPHWCLNEGDADDVANVMDSFTTKLRESVSSPPVEEPSRSSSSHRPFKKARQAPACVVPLPPDTDRARLVSESSSFQSRTQHLRYATRAKNIEANAKESPTLLLQDIVRLLIKAGQVERGDFVNVPYSTTGKKTHYDGGANLFAMTLAFPRYLHENMESYGQLMHGLMDPTWRKNPSFKHILESLATDWDRIENQTIKCCRVFPMIGHLVSFQDQRLDDMGSIESLPDAPSVQRWEKFYLNSVAGDPPLFEGRYQ